MEAFDNYAKIAVVIIKKEEEVFERLHFREIQCLLHKNYFFYVEKIIYSVIFRNAYLKKIYS